MLDAGDFLIIDRRTARERTSEADLRRGASVPRWVYIVAGVAGICLAISWRLTGAILGGDDSRLFYVFPRLWTEHTGTHAWLGNFVGYSPQYFFYPFTVMIEALNGIGLNSQAILLSLNVVVGFCAFVSVAARFCAPRAGSAAAVLGGLFYVFAPLVVLTQWASVLTSIYWIGLLPLLVLIIVRAIEHEKPRLLLLSVPPVIFFAPAVASVPWSVAAGIGIIAFFVVTSSDLRGIRVAVRYLSVLALALLACSSYWLVPLAVSATQGNAQAVTATSASQRVAAKALVRALGDHTNAAETLAANPGVEFLEAFQAPQRGLAGRSFTLEPLVLLVVLGAMLGMLFADNRATIRVMAGLGLISLLLGTLVADLWGVEEGLISALPGWAMFRNFYDRFAVVFVFFLALFVAMGISEVQRRLKQGAKRLSTSAIAVLFIALGTPLLGGSILRLPPFEGAPSRVLAIPDDLLVVAERLSADGTAGGVLEVPMLRPEWSTFKGASGHGLYLGISPLRTLADRTAFPGLGSFRNNVQPELPQIMEEVVSSADPVTLRSTLAWLGIDTVLVGRSVDPVVLARLGWSQPSSAGWERLLGAAGATLEWQSPERAIYVFGPDQSAPAIFARSAAGFDGLMKVENRWMDAYASSVPVDAARLGPEVRFWQRSRSEYGVSIGPSAEGIYLALNQLFDRGWRMTERFGEVRCQRYTRFVMYRSEQCRSQVEGGVSRGPRGPKPIHRLVNGYQNGWLLQPSTTERQFLLSFQPQGLRRISALMSLSAMLLCAAIAITGGRRLWHPWRQRGA